MYGRVGRSKMSKKSSKGKKQAKSAFSQVDFEKRVSFNDEVENFAYVEESSVTTDDESYSDDNNYDESDEEEEEEEEIEEVEVEDEEEEFLSESEEEEEDDEEEEEEEGEEEEGDLSFEVEVESLEEVEDISLEADLSSIDEVLSTEFEEETIEEVPSEEEEEEQESSELKPTPEVEKMIINGRRVCTFRPDEYLGGNKPSLMMVAPKKVKLKKSWLPSKNNEDDDGKREIEVALKDVKKGDGKISPVKKKFNVSHQSFFSTEVGGVTKSKVTRPKKKKVVSTPSKPAREAVPTHESTMEYKKMKKQSVTPERDAAKKIQETSARTRSVKKKAVPGENTAKQAAKLVVAKKKQSRDETKPSVAESRSSPKKKEAVSVKPRSPKKKENASVKPRSPKKKEAVFVKPKLSKAAQERLMEQEQRDTEMQTLRAKAADLRRQLRRIEVEKSAELADLAESTTQTMRNFLARTKAATKKKRAKVEKQTLKENTMKTNDLIDYLRNSNKKLREEGIKMAKAVQELREHNERIEEETSFRLDYLKECNMHHEKEIEIATKIQNQLNVDLPNYEILVHELSESVETRERFGQVEHRVKNLYGGCMNRIMEMVEDSCSNSDLVYRIVDLVNGNEDDVKRQSLDRRSSVSSPGAKTSSGARESARYSSNSSKAYRKGSFSEASKESKRNASVNVRRKSFGSMSGKELSFSDEETVDTSVWADSDSDFSLEAY